MIKKLKNITKKELDSIMNIWLQGNIDAHNFISRKYWEDNYNYVKSIMPNATIYVFYEENNIVAFTGLLENYVAGIFVEKEFRGKGIGKNILNQLKKDYQELFLNVYEKNHRAINFYELNGFKIIKSDIDKNTDEPEYIMNFSAK